jgi:F-type H+-transporting ATPase subunit epsilon
MSESTFPVEIVTPSGGIVYEHGADHVRLPGENGYFGILAHHADLMASLGTGRVDIDEPGGNHVELALCNGFVQIRGGRVRILAEAAERKERIDVERAREAEGRARQRLQNGEQVDRSRAEAALARALLRQQVAGVLR